MPGAKVAPVQHVLGQHRRDSAFKLVPTNVVITPSRNKVENGAANKNTSNQLN